MPINSKNKLITNEKELQQIAVFSFTDHNKTDFDIIETYDDFTKTEKLIFDYLRGQLVLGKIIRKNATIAKIIDCSRKTVTRATEKFRRLGLLEKFRKNKCYPNEYILSKKMTGTNSYRIWQHKQTKFAQDFYLNAITGLKKNVPLYKSINIYNNYNKREDIYKPIFVCTREARKLKSIYVENYGVFSQKEKKRLEFKQRLIEMLSQEQKERLIAKRNDPAINNIVNSEVVQNHIITPIMHKIGTALGFTFQEKLKLVKFPQEALEFNYNLAMQILGKPNSAIRNRVGWFYSLCLSFCHKKKLILDDRWFFFICDVFVISPDINLKPDHVRNVCKADTNSNKKINSINISDNKKKNHYCSEASAEVAFEDLYVNLSVKNKIEFHNKKIIDVDIKLNTAKNKNSWDWVQRYQREIDKQHEKIKRLQIDSRWDHMEIQEKVQVVRDKIKPWEQAIEKLRGHMSSHILIAIYQQHINELQSEIDNLLGDRHDA